MKKIKLATVFSGIGSIEQAFSRNKIPHDIIFACDSGDIVLDLNYQNEFKKVKKLSCPIEKRDYVTNLFVKKTKKTNFVKKTYLNNYDIKDNLWFEDIKLLDGKDFHNKIDLLVGGSPCQSFSSIGKKRGLEDTRGTLFFEFARLVHEIKPKVFIFENVFGLKNHDNGKTWEKIKEKFNYLGYSYKFKVLNSKDYNIPQSRRRLFVVGFKNANKTNKFRFPKELKLKYNMQDFLIDNCRIGNFKCDENGVIIKKEKGLIDEKYFLSEKIKKYVLSPGTKNFMHKNAKINLPIARALLSTQGNNHRSSVNNYVTTNNKIRALSPREALRLMGYPDSFKITVSKSQSYKQSGNSIVVDVISELLKEIMKVF